MSVNFAYPGDAVEAESSSPSRLTRMLRGFILAAAALLGAELIWLFLVSPCMPLSRVDISGAENADRDLILAQAGIDERSSYMSLNPRAAEKALGAVPWVESARVTKNFPSHAAIALTARKPLAASLAVLGGRQVLAVFDKQGVVFRIGRPGDGESAALPLISGLVFENPREGTRLPVLFNDFLARLDGIRSSAPELLTAVSEIRINRKTFEGFDLTVYPLHYPVRVLAGADLDEYMLRYILLMADVLLSRNPGIEEIDFRAGMASYTVKEASSG
jgi:cell division protein FtsQ